MEEEDGCAVRITEVVEAEGSPIGKRDLARTRAELRERRPEAGSAACSPEQAHAAGTAYGVRWAWLHDLQ